MPMNETMNLSLKVGILGTRGIPNRYGGFEQCAQFLAEGLVNRGHRVWVYNSHNHEYRQKTWKGVEIIHRYDPEYRIGTAGQFLYDLSCIEDARKRPFDVLLHLGYTSNSLWYWRWPKSCLQIVNMDGLEWKRSKYSRRVQRFLKQAEAWAAKRGDILVADSPGIADYLKSTYQRQAAYIPYGAYVFDQPEPKILEAYGLEAGEYDLALARMEPENNMETIIRAHLESEAKIPLVLIGSTANSFGQYLNEQYGNQPRIRFLGSIYEPRVVDNLRYHSRLYFHGHSVGGTNPSLLEAMGCMALVVAHDNVFNRAILGEDAYYFKGMADLKALLNGGPQKPAHQAWIHANAQKIEGSFNWERIVDQYESLFFESLGQSERQSLS